MWTIFFVLPNIQVGEPIGNDCISIAPYSDSRVKENVDNNPYAKALAEKFEDQFRRKATPSFLIVADSIPETLRDVEAIVGFRNIFALSTIIKGHEHSLTSTFVAYPLYSDYFELYPITISRNNDRFITGSPSVLGFDDEYKKFRGQTSPSLAGRMSVSTDTGDSLSFLLLTAWERRFLKGKTNEWGTTALFRSMQMAYQASAMPFKNYATIYDYGSSASLWVSALEILSHPRKGNADLSSVLKLIEQFAWNHKFIKRKMYKISRKKKDRINLPQRLYKELYDTRNEFLHGNPISTNRLHPFRNKRVPVITKFAPLLYKIALLSFLDQYRDRRKQEDWRKDYISKLLIEETLSEAILKAIR
jgi:hypothetical protein